MSTIDGERISTLITEIQELYCSDSRPWVIGYSGGKDSTTALQLVWCALSGLESTKCKKPVFAISSDTQVETPVVVSYLDGCLDRMNQAARDQRLPITAHKVQPRLDQTFWVNMIGRGYPAPYRRFRWCTDRLKIEPANIFIQDKVSEFGEVVLILGVRSSESATRAQVIRTHRRSGELLSPHSTLRGALVYTPIADFTTDDVWSYLLAVRSPWGGDNSELVTMYRNAQAGECPLVVDKTTPSCGNSRFGCWTCTVVERDRSMEALIDNGEDWMLPMLELRDWLAATREPSRKHKYREVRRRNGRIQQWGEDGSKIIWGPYKLEVRRLILRKLLETQLAVSKHQNLALISEDELHRIRKLWRAEEGDWEDSVPRIYREVMGEDLDWVDEDVAMSSAQDSTVLREVCAERQLPPELVRELLDLERELQGLGRRKFVFSRMERTLAKDWRNADDVLKSIGWREGATEDCEEDATNAD